MDIVLLSEVIKEQDLWAYPYNALRNQALARADTDVRLPLLPPDVRTHKLSQASASQSSSIAVCLLLRRCSCLVRMDSEGYPWCQIAAPNMPMHAARLRLVIPATAEGSADLSLAICGARVRLMDSFSLMRRCCCCWMQTS